MKGGDIGMYVEAGISDCLSGHVSEGRSLCLVSCNAAD